VTLSLHHNHNFSGLFFLLKTETIPPDEEEQEEGEKRERG
jgi:hypothetical protein